MNRTNKLMAAVAASFLVIGTLPVPGAPLPASGQAAPQPDNSWKTDPQVQKSADAIFAWLKGTTAAQAKTQEDVHVKFPEIVPALADKALKLLVWQGAVRQMGDGSKDSPFKYFEVRSGFEG